MGFFFDANTFPKILFSILFNHEKEHYSLQQKTDIRVYKQFALNLNISHSQYIMYLYIDGIYNEKTYKKIREIMT